MCRWDVCKQVLRLLISSIFVVGATGIKHSIGKRSLSCILPPYPNDGRYEVAGDPSAGPGDVLKYAYLNVTCDPGTKVIGNNVLLCVQGQWSTTMPKCVDVCQLRKDPSIEFSCKRLVSNNFGACEEFEPTGTRVKSECRPGYYSPSALPVMRCLGGAWDFVARCSPECGVIPENATTLPWHTYIYKRKENKLKAICSGVLITDSVVVSAAHCFREQKLDGEGDFEVVVSPSHRHLEIESDQIKQTYPVKVVKIPERYQGARANFQQDIALLKLRVSVEYSVNVKPVCVDFDPIFNKKQMTPGAIGTVGVWGNPLSKVSVLEIQKYPYIPVKTCIEMALPEFRKFISGDKFCAGIRNRTMIGRGNSGAGLAFPEAERGITRYYLRGIVSTAPVQEIEWTPSDFVAFTKIISHEYFIKENLV